MLKRKVPGLPPGASFRLTVDGSQVKVRTFGGFTGSPFSGPFWDSSTPRTFEPIPQ